MSYIDMDLELTLVLVALITIVIAILLLRNYFENKKQNKNHSITLEQKNRDLQGEITQLRLENNSLRLENNSLLLDNNKLKEKNTALQPNALNIERYETESDRLQTENKMLHEQNNFLLQENKDLQNDRKLLQERIDNNSKRYKKIFDEAQKKNYELKKEKIQHISLKEKCEYLTTAYPELVSFFNKPPQETDLQFDDSLLDDFDGRTFTLNNALLMMGKNKDKKLLTEHSEYYAKIKSLEKQIDILNNLLEKSTSNIQAIPYMAQIIADYETIGLENLAVTLDWGKSQERAKKVKSIRELKQDTRTMIEKNMDAKYKLAYLLNLFPNLEDVIDCEFQQLPAIDVETISDYDRTRDFLSKEEYSKLSVTERNQLALDRYKRSHNKSKWQIGRDYELYIGYTYETKGYTVDYFGSYMGLEDLGRDLICQKNNKVLIVQCKYWSEKKLIHEKHITQLYGTMISYCIENNLSTKKVSGILVTNIKCSDKAKQMADFLSIKIKENAELKDYPCIKCNIGHDANGHEEKIYHLPFDQQYDATKITKPGEFFATTVKEAEDAGFRRAHKWFNN